MEAKVSEVLENILSMLALKGSFESEEKEEGIFISIETEDPGILIGHQGETLSSLQLLVNLIVSKNTENPKRVIIDVSGWRKNKEEELVHKARDWAKQVLDEQKPLELAPMPSWQRRIVHMTIDQTSGVKTESVGEGIDRHLVISPDDGSSESNTPSSEETVSEEESDSSEKDS